MGGLDSSTSTRAASTLTELLADLHGGTRYGSIPVGFHDLSFWVSDPSMGVSGFLDYARIAAVEQPTRW